jgi:hypothetical protein
MNDCAVLFIEGGEKSSIYPFGPKDILSAIHTRYAIN